MPVLNKTLTVCVALLALSLSACNKSNAEPAAGKSSSVAACSDCGTVSNIEQVKVKGGASGIGAVTGAVIGGVLGHQVGDGRGKDAATVAGAAGGAYAGHESEKRYNATTHFRVTVSMESGGSRTVETSDLNGAGVGSRVKVSGDSIRVI